MSFLQRLLSSTQTAAHLIDVKDEKEIKEVELAPSPTISSDQPLNPFTDIQVLKKHSDLVKLLCKIDEDRFASACDDSTVIIWQSKSGRIFHILQDASNTEVHLTHNLTCLLPVTRSSQSDLALNTHIIAAGSDKHLTMWNVNTGEVVLQIKHKSSIKCMLSIGGGVLCVCGVYLSLVDLQSGDVLADLSTSTLSPAVTPSPTHTPTTTTPGVDAYYEQELSEIRAVTTGTDTEHNHGTKASVTNETAVKSPSSIPSDITLVIHIKQDMLVGSVDNELVVFQYILPPTDGLKDTESAASVRVYKRLPPHREAITSLINITDGRFCSASYDGSIQLWASNGLCLLKSLNDHYPYIGLEHRYLFSVQEMTCVDERYMLAGVGHGFILYDMVNCRVLAHRTNAHYSKVLHLELMCDGYYLLTCSEDGSIRVWGNADHIQSTAAASAVPPNTTTRQPTTSRLDRFLGPWKGKVQGGEVDVCTPDLVGECLAHSGTVQMLLKLKEHKLVSSGTDGMIIIWTDTRLEENLLGFG